MFSSSGALLGLAAAAGLVNAVDFQVASTGGAPVSPDQYGLFFEDINHSGDGGLYAELNPNRAFQANSSRYVNTEPWSPVGDATLQIVTEDPAPLSWALPFSVRVSGTSGQVGLSNPGFWGYDVKPQPYAGQFYIKGDFHGNMTASLQSALDNTVFGSVQIPVASTAADGWVNIKYTLNPTVGAPNSNNTFSLSFDAASASGPIQLNLISLFPPTYNDRPNGNRIDLMETLKGLAPSFLRFPGGNNLEGDSNTTNHWRWNETIGPLTERPGRMGVWGYYNSDGLGLDEYFGWCEDLDMEPILGVWDGFYLNGPAVPQDELDPDIQDVLNELEYILGDETTHYGAQRCQNGHPEPYKLQYVEIGNEDNLGGGFPTYSAYRYQMFHDAIKQQYPNLTLIASTVELNQDQYGQGSAGDYHQYTLPDYFISQSSFFDANTTDHQTLIGEFASVQYNEPAYPNGTLPTTNYSNPKVSTPFWIGTVAEIVFALGAERNAAKILGASYAPLFQNLNSYTWTPDLISFSADPADNTLSTSYQALQLVGSTRFTQTRPANVTDQPGAPGPAFSSSSGPVFWAAGSNTVAGSEVLKLAVYNATGSNGPLSVSNPTPPQHNPDGNDAPPFATLTETVPVTVAFDGVPGGTEAQLIVLSAQGGNPNATALPGQPDPLTKYTVTITSNEAGVYNFTVPDLSVAVLETKPLHGNYSSPAGQGGYGGCKGGVPRASYQWQAWLASGAEGTGCS